MKETAKKECQALEKFLAENGLKMRQTVLSEKVKIQGKQVEKTYSVNYFKGK